MAQSYIQLPVDTTNTGKKVDTFITDTAAHYREVLCIGDKATDAAVAPVDATKGLSVDLTNTGANTTPIVITVGTAALSLGKAEDAPHASSDTGVMVLGVRNDSGAVLAGTTGDYIPFSMTALGEVRVSGSSATTQYAEDVPHVSGDSIVALGCIRRDTTPSSSAGTAGDYTIPTVDGNGRLYTNTALYDAAGAALTASNDYTHDAALTVGSTAGPVTMFRASSAADAVVTDQDAVLGVASLTGKQIVLPYANSSQAWSYAAVAGGIVATTTNTAKTAGAAGVFNYVTAAHVINSHQTIGTEVVINDGVSGTTLFRGWAQFAGGGFSVKFDPPLKGTAATLIEVKEVTATGTAGVLVNLQGFTSKD